MSPMMPMTPGGIDTQGIDPPMLHPFKTVLGDPSWYPPLHKHYKNNKPLPDPLRGLPSGHPIKRYSKFSTTETIREMLDKIRKYYPKKDPRYSLVRLFNISEEDLLAESPENSFLDFIRRKETEAPTDKHKEFAFHNPYEPRFRYTIPISWTPMLTHPLISSPSFDDVPKTDG